jgi:predicted enzyme related to lactoylglutathione lyase
MTETKPRFFGQFVWHDLMTVDLERSKEFYGELLGWQMAQQEMGPMGSYTLIQHQGQSVGGMVGLDPRHGLSSHWLPYLTVEELDGLCKRIGKLGGSVAVEPRGVPGVGRFAILHDPANGVFSAMEMTGGMPGPARSREDGAFYWDQLLTNNSAVMGKFYTEVFGWSVDEYEMGDQGHYGVFKSNEQPVAGMFPIGPGDPRKPGWIPYVAMEEIEDAAEKVRQLKGDVVTEPEIVYGVGKYTVVRDPIGATFGLFKPAG